MSMTFPGTNRSSWSGCTVNSRLFIWLYINFSKSLAAKRYNQSDTTIVSSILSASESIAVIERPKPKLSKSGSWVARGHESSWKQVFWNPLKSFEHTHIKCEKMEIISLQKGGLAADCRLLSGLLVLGMTDQIKVLEYWRGDDALILSVVCILYLVFV